MSTLNEAVLSADLNFLISQSPVSLTGVTPSAIASIVYVGSLQSLEEGYEVELSGREVTIDTEFVLNKTEYSTLPSKGAVLLDTDGTKYKVMDIKRERLGCLVKFYFTSQYARGK